MAVEYKVVETGLPESMGKPFAVIRELPSGDLAGYDAEADRNQEQVHFRIYRPWSFQHAVADSRTYATREEAEAALPQNWR